VPTIIPASGFGRSYQQTAKGGVGLTSGGSAHTMGSWATLIDPVSYDVCGLFLNIFGVSGAAADTRGLLDIGVAPTGGGNEQVVIPSLDVGAAAASATGGKTYFFPLYVPKGKAIRARWQSVTASDTTIAVVAHAFELPFHGYAEDAPQEWVQYGAAGASSTGVAVTSGSAAYGTEAQITASTSRAHRWFHVGIDWGTNTAITSGRYRVRLARDTGATEVIGVWEFMAPTAGEDILGPFPILPACMPIPAGSPLYVDVDGAAAEAMAAIVYAY